MMSLSFLAGLTARIGDLAQKFTRGPRTTDHTKSVASYKKLQQLGGQLEPVNLDPAKGPIRWRMTYPVHKPRIDQGLRERRRRVRQIVQRIIPFAQLGPDPFGEFQLAKRNYAPAASPRWKAAA